MLRAISRVRSESSVSGPSEPGTVGTPASFMAWMAETLSPMRRIVSAFGPMNMKPLFSTWSAKSAFSARKPYPGWIALVSVISAAAMMAGTFR